MTETVVTSRRAALRGPAGWTAGRLRLTDRALGFTAAGAPELVVDLATIRSARTSRPLGRRLLIETADGVLSLRCHAPTAVALLVRSLSGAGGAPAGGVTPARAAR